MLLPCVLYALINCVYVALCATGDPSAPPETSRGSTTQPAPIAKGRGAWGQRSTGVGLVVDDIQRENWLPLKNVLPAPAALLAPTAISDIEVIPSTKVATLIPFSTPAVIPTSPPNSHALELSADGAEARRLAVTPLLGTQLRRRAPGNATAAPGPTATIRETTTVYVGADGCTGTPAPTGAMARPPVPTSDAGQKGGIAGGTVGAVLMVAVLTLFCYRRARRRTRARRGFMSLPGSGSGPDAAERGMAAHLQGGLFGSETKTASAAGSFETDGPQTPGPAAAPGGRTSEQVPICFRPPRRLISRYPSLPVTPTASIWPSDYLNPVVRETALVPRPLRLAVMTATTAAATTTLAWSRSDPSAQARTPPRRQAAGGRGVGSRSRSRNTTVTSSSGSVYSSSEAALDFAEHAAGGARASRAGAQRASGATDASGLRSTIGSFPRPPPYTFSRGDGRGLGASWRESFVFSTPEDEVLLAFPKLARQVGGKLI